MPWYDEEGGELPDFPKETETESEIIERLQLRVGELEKEKIAVDKHITRAIHQALLTLPLIDEKHHEGYVVGLRNFTFAIGQTYYNYLLNTENSYRNSFRKEEL